MLSTFFTKYSSLPVFGAPPPPLPPRGRSPAGGRDPNFECLDKFYEKLRNEVFADAKQCLKRLANCCEIRPDIFALPSVCKLFVKQHQTTPVARNKIAQMYLQGHFIARNNSVESGTLTHWSQCHCNWR